MNDFEKTLCERRSVRGYKSDPVADDVLGRIIEAGTFAPTGRNKQSPVIIAVTNKEIRDKLSKLNAEIMGANTDPFYGAPVVLVVLANKEIPTYLYDGSLVMGNLMNAAYSEGVSSCWIHRAKEVFETDEGKKILKTLGITGEYEGIGNCVLGYSLSAEVPKAMARKEN